MPTNRPSKEHRGRPKTYTGSVASSLVKIWRTVRRFSPQACGGICSKRVHPILANMVASLERHQELKLDVETKRLLLAVTIDRLLRPYKTSQRCGQSSTKPGGLLKNQIPILTFADWDDTQAGFVEIDLVAHCGETVVGQFVHSLTATDVATGWTECFSLLHRSQIAVYEANDQLRERLPFPLLVIDSDNNSVFINELMLNYCQTNRITLTRGRPYKKNGQCFVAQKNWSIVRRTIGYQWYECHSAHQLLGGIYDALHRYTNLFQPTFKRIGMPLLSAENRQQW